MTLTAKDVAEITRLLEDSSFDELQLEIDGLKLSLRRGTPVRLETSTAPAAAVAGPASTPGPGHEPVARSTAAVSDPDVLDIPAPMLGTYYRAPKPGAAPYVEVGSIVEQDSIVGIIEVMKLMNAVRAGIRGTVVEIHARDGTLVEYGEVLLRVRATREP